MKIVFVHYHLRPGGVTQVVFHQASALREAGEEVLVLCGEAPPLSEQWAEIPFEVVSGLRYDRYRPAESQGNAVSALAEKLALSMINAIRSRWPGGADLVHIHNPLIRKNSLLTGTIKELAKQMPLLLQNHDLAEDFRPDVYTGEEYPADCHYCVINSRDYRFLLEAGLKPEGLHLLPNEVQKLTLAQGFPKNRFVYPVRGIRRKNIGEALFLSIFTGLSGPVSAMTGTSIAITQPPTTEQDIPVYRRWKEMADELRLPVEFEAGLNVSFADVMGRAKAVITTSVKEGFGFSFLEPWTAYLPVVGRRIGYVCHDFEEAGLNMNGLYPALNIPAEYTEPEILKKKTAEALTRVYTAFGLSLPSKIPAELDDVFNRDFYDFGIMDEETQEKIIRLAVKDKTIRRRITNDNPFLECFPDLNIDSNIIEVNRGAVLSSYSRETILAAILEIYRKALVPVTQSISRKRLLELYLDPRRLYLTGISPAESPAGGQGGNGAQEKM